MFWKFLKKTTEEPTSPSANPAPKPGKLSIGYLKKLIPIGQLPDEELQNLNISQHTFAPGQIVFNRGERADALMFLLSGSIYMEAANGSGYLLEEQTFKAYHPLSTPTEHYFTAIAKSASQVIYLPLSTLQHSVQKSLDLNLLSPNEILPAELTANSFFNDFSMALRRQDIRLPSLPDVAFRLRSALQKDINVTDAAKIINLDPVIASKLIQVANSPLFRTVNPIANSHDAINRLGFKATQNLVTSISLHNLFRSNNPHLNQLVQQLWRQSIQIASLSYTLAGVARTINPDEALLAGLTHNIGALPIIAFAESLENGCYSEQELTQTIDALQIQVSEFILKKWNFPDNLQHIPSLSANWYIDPSPNLQLSDIVLLARFHAQLGAGKTHKLPPLNTLPAFSKLGEHALTPDLSLQALQDAKQQIAEALSFFRA